VLESDPHGVGGQDTMAWVGALTPGLHISHQCVGKDSQHIVQTPRALAILS